MIINKDFDNNGVKILCTQQDEMLMDIAVKKLKSGESVTVGNDVDETAVLLVCGNVEFAFATQKISAKRESCFDGKPYCLHTPKGVSSTITAVEDSEIIIQSTENNKEFPIKFYDPSIIKTEIFGADVWEQSAKRQVVTVFDYANAPYSNLVIGEVVNMPGRWSSYIPHSHPQPEVYYYKFSKPQGFGASFIGDEAFMLKDSCASIIKGGLTHPQVTAPGYSMYYCWMIRHLENNPWTSRDDDPAHTWLLDK